MSSEARLHRLNAVAPAPGTDSMAWCRNNSLTPSALKYFSFRSWIHLHLKRLRVALATDRQLHRVSSRQHWLNAASKEPAATTAAGTRGSLRWSRTQVPNPSMHARRRRKRFRRARPERRKVEFVGIDGWKFVFARVTANHLAGRIQNLEGHRPFGVRLQIEIDHRA